MSQLVIFIVMLNIIGFSLYARAENKEFTERKQSVVNFLFPIGSILGIFIFKYDFKEQQKSIVLGTFFVLFLSLLTLVML